MKHRTRLTTGKPGVRYDTVLFENVTMDHNPVLATCRLGDELPYGTLTAYLLRRFGYPNVGWDGRNELVQYRLSTAHPAMCMTIVPSVSDFTSLSVNFVVERGLGDECEAYERRHEVRWRTAAMDRAQEQGLPDWMDAWVALCNDVICPSLMMPSGLDWRSSGDLVGFNHSEIGLKARAFYAKLLDEYQTVEPRPAFARPDNLEDWEDSDPLKPLARAAVQALDDLLTPVGVRDDAINALGPVEYTGRERRAAAVAGFPSGALGNVDPRGFAELHNLLLDLGGGDPKRGIAKATRILRSAQVRKAA